MLTINHLFIFNYTDSVLVRNGLVSFGQLDWVCDILPAKCVSVLQKKLVMLWSQLYAKPLMPYIQYYVWGRL